VFSPDVIKFSQSSVNGVEELTENMRKIGWPDSAGAIDVVKMVDGTLVTVDNTRVLAASRAGVNVKATVRAAEETVDLNRAITLKDRAGNTPNTWGQAVKNRISNQSKAYQEKYPNGSYVTGSVE
jgi:uncharacterized NAD-dependent epimerase/dehydratase family protein